MAESRRASCEAIIESRPPGNSGQALGVPLRAAKPALWSIADQACVSLAHFAANLMLAQAIEPVRYGAFAIAYMALAVLLEVQVSVVLSPLALLGTTRYVDNLPEYVRSVRTIHFALAIGTGLVTAAVGMLANNHDLKLALFTLGATQVFVMSFYVERRLCQLVDKQKTAARGSFAYLALVLGGMWFARQGGILTPGVAVGVLGVGAAMAALSISRDLRAIDILSATPSGRAVSYREVISLHAKQVKWTLPASILNSAVYQGQIGFAGIASGLSGAGAVRAAITLVMPVGQLSSALNSYFLPRVSRASQIGHGQFRKVMASFSVSMVGASSAYSVLMMFVGDLFFEYVYSGGYREGQAILPWVVLASIPMAVGTVLQAGLQARGRFGGGLAVVFTGALVAVPIMAYASFEGNLRGIAIAALIGYSVSALAAAACLFKRRGLEKPH